MIIVDTNVWVSFLKGEKKARSLQEMITDNHVVMHPYVYGELLLGGISQNAELLFQAIMNIPLVKTELVYYFIIKNKIKSRGIGWVDVNILASALSENFKIHTFDENLVSICKEFNCSFN